MAELKKSKITKAAVIDASKKLFFENGYINTHLNDIAKESGVNAGSMYYHFKKKCLIAEIIYSNMTAETKQIVSEVFIDSDLQVRTAIETLIFWRLFFNDDNFRRFLYEISKENVAAQLAKNTGIWLFDLHNKQYQLGFNENYIKMINLTCFASEEEMAINIQEGYIPFSEEEAAEYDIRLIYELMKINNNRIEEIILLAKKAFSEYDVYLHSDFKTVLTKIDK